MISFHNSTGGNTFLLYKEGWGNERHQDVAKEVDAKTRHHVKGQE